MDSDELLDIAPNDKEIRDGFGIRDATTRKKIVNWMLLVRSSIVRPYFYLVYSNAGTIQRSSKDNKKGM